MTVLSYNHHEVSGQKKAREDTFTHQINDLFFQPHNLNQINLHQDIVIPPICKGSISRAPAQV